MAHVLLLYDPQEPQHGATHAIALRRFPNINELDIFVITLLNWRLGVKDSCVWCVGVFVGVSSVKERYEGEIPPPLTWPEGEKKKGYWGERRIKIYQLIN